MATIAEQLADAKAKYHSLLTGAAVKVVVDQNGERVEYVAASAPRLAAYIAQLERQNDPCVRMGPMQVWL